MLGAQKQLQLSQTQLFSHTKHKAAMARKQRSKRKQEQQQVEEEAEDAQNQQLVKEQALFFFSKDAVLPQEIYLQIMSYVPAFPYLFSMRRVCKGWRAFIQERVYEMITELDLLPHFDKEQQRHWWKYLTSYDKSTIHFLAAVFPNVTKLYVPLSVCRVNKMAGRQELFRKFEKLQELHVVPCDNDAAGFNNTWQWFPNKSVVYGVLLNVYVMMGFSYSSNELTKVNSIMDHCYVEDLHASYAPNKKANLTVTNLCILSDSVSCLKYFKFFAGLL